MRSSGLYQILIGKSGKVILGHTDLNWRIVIKWFLKERLGYVLDLSDAESSDMIW